MENTVKNNIFKSFGYADEQDFIENGIPTTDAIRKGFVEYDDELQKAVYADTAENRKLGRVGQEYHRGKDKKEEPETTNNRRMTVGQRESGESKAAEKAKREYIKDVLENGAGPHDDDFIEKHPGKTYKTALKKYGVENLSDLCDKLGEEDNYEEYDRLYTKMLKEIPASAFYN